MGAIRSYLDHCAGGSSVLTQCIHPPIDGAYYICSSASAPPYGEGMSNAREKPKHIQPLLLTRNESASVLGISVRTIDYLIATRQLPTRQIGRRRLIPYVSIARFACRDHPKIVPKDKTSGDDPRIDPPVEGNSPNHLTAKRAMTTPTDHYHSKKPRWEALKERNFALPVADSSGANAPVESPPDQPCGQMDFVDSPHSEARGEE